MTMTLLCSLFPLILITVIVVCIFWLYRQRNQRFLQQQQQLCTGDAPVSSLLRHQSVIPTYSLVTHFDIRLLQVKARGRFGAVWKAQLCGVDVVAVKVFPLHGQQSWINEQRFYALPHVRDCENILRFIGAESHDTELWLITEYHDIGSLGDYLKSHTLSLRQLASVATSVIDGVSFLHSDVDGKPSVAHRDVKCQNVLLRHDMTACIADFGFAVVLDGQSCNAFPQVCTVLSLLIHTVKQKSQSNMGRGCVTYILHCTTIFLSSPLLKNC